LLDCLSADERVRHARLRQPDDRDRFVVAHALLRILLGRRLGVPPAAVALTDTGKPRLAGPSRGHEFSLSHSGRRVVVAIAASTPVGVDVERVSDDRDLDVLIERVLGAGERSALAGLVGPARREAFYRCWVRKEATVKATGHGLRVPLAEVTVSGPKEPAALVRWSGDDAGPSGIQLHDLDAGEGHAACLAALAISPLAIEEHDSEALLARP
jgi:4'-phosphopantetheinyl transferase